ncbi:MAG: serine/threonine-protein kinase [Isosphaeraceae bacterium]
MANPIDSDQGPYPDDEGPDRSGSTNSREPTDSAGDRPDTIDRAFLGLLSDPEQPAGKQPTGIDRHFEVIERIGGGGMGEVFRARDRVVGREVAYKVIRAESYADPQRLGRFREEIRITNLLYTPGIVPIYATGIDSGAGRPAYAMELVRGPTLDEAIGKLRELGPDIGGRARAANRLLRHILSVCRIVAHAHSKGYVHCDLKPINVAIVVDQPPPGPDVTPRDPVESARVLDWGLAREAGQPDLLGFGTAPYIDASCLVPKGQSIGPSRDVHALGWILKDFADAEEGAGTRKSGRSRRALRAIIARAIAPSPGAEYPDAAALADDLDRLIAGEPVLADREPVGERFGRWARTNRGKVTAATVLALVAAAAIPTAWFAARAQGETRRWGLVRQAASDLNAYQVMMARNQSRGALEADREQFRRLLGAIRSDATADQLAGIARDFEAILDDEQLRAAEPYTPEETRAALTRAKDTVEALVREDPAFEAARFVLAQCYSEVAHHRVNAKALQEPDAAAIGRVLMTGETPPLNEDSRKVLAWCDRAEEAARPLVRGGESSEEIRDLLRSIWGNRLGAYMTSQHFIEALHALRKIDEWSDGRPTFLKGSRGLLLKAAEKQQSKMPWSHSTPPDHATSCRMADMLLQAPGVSQSAVYNAACAYAMGSADASATPRVREGRAGRSVELLNRLVADHYFHKVARTTPAPTPGSLFLPNLAAAEDTLKELETDTDLDALRSRDDFRDVLSRARADAENQARGAP